MKYSSFSVSRLFLYFFLSFFVTFGASAQYRIELKIKGLTSKDKCYLVHAFRDEKSYIFKDTTDADASGNVVFEGKENLPQGLYSIAQGQSKLFDFVVADQKFTIETDTTNLVGNMKITGSKEAADFAEFIKKRIEIVRNANNSSPQEQQAAYDKSDELTKNYIKNHPNTFSANFLKATLSVDIPQLPANATRKDTVALTDYYYKHYFDNLDLGDDRLLRTPIIENMFDNFLNNVSYYEPDTIIKLADNLLIKTKPKSDFRKYLLLKFGQKYIMPDLLGRDKVYIHIAEKYILAEPDLFDSVTVKNNKEFVKAMKPLLLGNVIPNMQLADTLDLFTPLHQVQAKYTLVMIYDPKCGHCQETTKKLVENQDKLLAKGVKVYLACGERNKEEWKKFVKEYKTQKFINVFDSQTITDFNNTFNVKTYPAMFLVDKDKKILSNRKLEVDDFLRMIEGIEKNVK
ncbi:MAG: thioredoxin-like domain-containing protein [Spirosomataceae bacterium]